MAQTDTGGDSTLHHVAVRVSDLERSAAWYESVFGFSVEFKGRVREGTLIAMLRTAGGAGVELFELEPRETVEWNGPIPALQEGIGHFALVVPDVERAFDRAIASGGRPLWPPREAPIPGIRVAFVADPDGNLVELVQHVG